MPLYRYVKKEIRIEPSQVIKPPKNKEIAKTPKNTIEYDRVYHSASPFLNNTKKGAPKPQVPASGFNYHQQEKIIEKTKIISRKESKTPDTGFSLSFILSFVFILSGAGMLLLVILPVANWQFIQNDIAPETRIFKPISQFPGNAGKGAVLAESNEQTKDLTKASNWFPNSLQIKKNRKIKEYTLSIPKLKIKDARVIIGGDDLIKGLIQYEDSALPGEYGNTVIFGHSVLPEFFDPENYATIFATLPTLKRGDKVYTNVDGIEYKFVVYDFITVDPTDLSVLEQKDDNYYLSLITCVPPGLKWKRLVVKAKLEPME